MHRNLLIILPHALRSDAFSDERAWPLSTPNFEQIARRGIRLVATSASPADPAGMISLLTGLHARQHGQLNDLNIPPPAATPPMTSTTQTNAAANAAADRVGTVATSAIAAPGMGRHIRPHLAHALPGWLSSAGYHTAGVGCIDLIANLLDQTHRVASPGEVQPEHCAYFNAMQQRGLTKALSEQRKRRLRYGPFDPDRLLIEPQDDIDGYIATQSVAMLDQMPTDRPWALFVMFSGPGNDLPPPTLYEGLVDPQYLRESFAPADFRRVDALAEPAYPRALLQRLEPRTIARIRGDYLGRVGLLDFAIGKLDKALRQRPDRAHNWLALASDRGYLLGEHGLVGHRSFLAGAVETPMMLAAPLDPPRDQQPLWYDDLVSTTDIAPTLAALAGADVPATVVGRSMLPIFNGDPVEPALVGGNISEFNHRLMLETERHRIIFQQEKREAIALFDLLNDSDERNNLIHHHAGKNLLDAMRWRLGEALLPLRAANV